MFSKSLAVAAGLSVLAIAAPAHAGDISVISGSGIRSTTTFNGPIGQSFTSIDSALTSVGFQFQLFNTPQPTTPFTLQLLNGSGLGGTQIFTTQFTLPTTIPTSGLNWFDVSLPNIATTIGSVYTFVLSNSSLRYGVVLGPDINIQTGQILGGDAYTGGQAFGVQSYPNCPNTPASQCDLNFRVSGTTATGAVPEPATWAMMIAGFGMMGGALRRRSRTAQFVAA
ncbi:PEP-CTERM sorting domain-containing protein [Sphingomonas panacisoli]|uniref:PEP-CTERM sorting domain-containing protein n=1 Tax=Sphingomonas panacisoli TaxID=1813879 RepID=A0A5B8LIY0_9SPHN|nr:PEPxxWA-CTERM sorting domain-containing protein [Sphingomonas panacisoli]QDZ08168.1 PEP-CTERM sorting domain-containing protein [Sphingomonas panacisoli]